MILSPAIACQLCALAYDPAVIAGGAPPGLDVLGWQFACGVPGTDVLGRTVIMGYSATSADGWQLYAIHGTRDGADLLTDASVGLMANPWGPGRVHSGFGREARSLLLPPSGISLAQTIVIGHSLGGATARQLSMRLGKVATVITWGEPRSCDGTAASYAASCAMDSSRRRNTRDPVPLVPIFDPTDIEDTYEHVGSPVTLGSWGSIFDIESTHDIAGYLAHESGNSP